MQNYPMHKETFCTPKVSNDTSMLQKTMQCTISDALHFMFYNIFSGKSVQFNRTFIGLTSGFRQTIYKTITRAS